MQTVKKKQIISILAAVTFTAVISTVGTVLALRLKTTEKRGNNFGFGKVRIRLEEEHWDEEDEHIVYPGKVSAKNPKIVNTGKTDLYAYLEVRIPYRYVTYTELDEKSGKIVVADDSPKWMDVLYYDDPLGENWIQIDSDWFEDADGIEIDLEQLSDFDAELYHVYRYAYTKMLSPDDQTTELFRTVTFSSDILEGDLADLEYLDIPITAYAIQSEYMTDKENSLELAFQQYLSNIGS